MKYIREKIIISGRVQGVGFRYFIYHNAAKMNVKGAVENTDEGVLAIFEGKENDVARLIDVCREGPPGSRVEKISAIREEFSGEFKDFRIKK